MHTIGPIFRAYFAPLQENESENYWLENAFCPGLPRWNEPFSQEFIIPALKPGFLHDNGIVKTPPKVEIMRSKAIARVDHSHFEVRSPQPP